MRYLAFSAFVLLQAVSGRQDPKDLNGTWTAEFHNARVFLQIRTSAPDGRSSNNWSGDWSTGQTMPPEDFSGLPAADEHFTASNLKFELRREAGTFAFDGAFRDGRGAGLFMFTPRQEYVAEMKAIGYADDLPLWRRYQLAVHDVGPKYIRALKAEGYDKLTLDEIQRGRNHGVSLEYIRDMKAQGYTIIGWDTLVRTRDHGVTADYVKGMKAAGFTDMALEDLVRTKDHGVTPASVDEMRKAGFKDASLVDLVRAKDHGVSADYVSDMKDLGIKDLTLQQMVRLRDHGITPGFVNHVRARGFKDATVDELVRLKNGGLWRD